MSLIIIKVTYPNREEANKSIHHLLQKKLISSANSFQIKSTSSWSGEIKQVDEILVLLNTKKNNWNKVKLEIQKTHPYKVPCIVKLNVTANSEYESWVNQQTK